MFDFTATYIDKIIIHKVGNKVKEEELTISNAPLETDSEIKQLMQQYFLKPFKTEELYQLFNETDVRLNQTYKAVTKIFEDPENFIEQSGFLANWLYECGNHPNIKNGEFYVVLFKDCIIGGENVDFLGIFKSENKDTYIRIFPGENNFSISADTGVNINKLDKGCVIFNTDKENGYKVCMVDKTNKSNEAQYWRDEFLGLKSIPNHFYQTENYIKICKGFVEDVYNDEHEVDKPSQIDMLNRSNSFFKEKDNFSQKEFENNVMMGENNIIEAFNDYKKKYVEENEVALDDSFAISKAAYNQTKKVFKSVLKLDKNFHVYIHGNRDYIIKGVDEETGLNYYQLFFEREE